LADITIENISDLLQEVSAEEPCGVNLEYDPDFLVLEQAIKGKPEVQYGNSVTPEEPPDWKQVMSLALELIQRSRDLRIALPLSRSLLKLQGFPGFSAGLSLTEQLLEQRWDSVHPQLDPDDGFDPMSRINTLSALCESSTVLRDVREAWLVTSKACGRFSLRDIDIATGEMEMPTGGEKVSLSVIDAAFKDTDPSILQTTYSALDQAYKSIGQIDNILTKKIGASQSLDLSMLSKMLKRACDFVGSKMAPEPGMQRLEASIPDVGAGEINKTQAAKAVISGEIRSRDDVIRTLEKICAYYEQHEPSSPIPLLLMRALRLVDKSFIEIIQDMAPDSLAQIHNISGIQAQE
jgi:type VI secretion system protein ImpA